MWFASLLIGFLLSGLLGNWLIQRWQYRNWVNQQRVLKSSGELAQLRALVEKIMTMADARNYRARKLCRSINRAPDAEIQVLKAEYEKSVTTWNDHWNSFCVGLTLYADYQGFSKRLESDLQTRFVRAGGLLLYCLRHSTTEGFSKAKFDLEEELNSISGTTFNFCRDLMNLLKEKEETAFANLEHELTEDTINLLPTRKLIKFLFIPPKLS